MASSSRRFAQRWAASASYTPAGKTLRKCCAPAQFALAFPGGDYDAFRPTLHQRAIDFDGRTGYVRTAINSGVPIVPAVSIGGQETQLFLTRGNWLAERLGLKRIRMEILPVTIGIPFGLTVFFPANLPLPSKIVYQVSWSPSMSSPSSAKTPTYTRSMPMYAP